MPRIKFEFEGEIVTGLGIKLHGERLCVYMGKQGV
jgi:hypothetical protein